jgi:hypothetical protein
MAIRVGTTAHDQGGIRVSTTDHASWFDWLTLPTVNVAGTYWYGVTGALTSAGTVYAVAVTTDKTDPSALQIRSGLDGAGAAAAGTGSQSTLSNFNFDVVGATLDDSPDHHLHIVAWDGVNYTSVVRLRNEILFVENPNFYNPGAAFNLTSAVTLDIETAGFLGLEWSETLQGALAIQVELGEAGGLYLGEDFAASLLGSLDIAVDLGKFRVANCTFEKGFGGIGYIIIPVKFCGDDE